ncbi:tagaturonate reductase [Sphingobacterium detergens]
MNLDKQHLAGINHQEIEVPKESIFTMPERVIQFGTGALLRGLPDDYIHQANQKGIFNGRIVVVKSTRTGNTTAFDNQNGLYTLITRGLEKGKIKELKCINASISRVLSAHDSWEEILTTATSPLISILISNTTEAGLLELGGAIDDSPPVSFAAKVTAYLYHRFSHFNGDNAKGLVIIPTELVSDNAKVLKHNIVWIAEQQKLSKDFIDWIDKANYFCNSLVDRIVPGKVSEEDLSYTDQLAIMAEPYKLWAIESDNQDVKNILSFALADSTVKIVPSIAQYRELKLRLLNAPHILCCGIALLSNTEFVKDFFNNEILDRYIQYLLFKEISPIVEQSGISHELIQPFGEAVIDRFKNPFLLHKWQSIAFQYTAKLNMRVCPLIEQWYSKQSEPPIGIAIGLAAYILVICNQVKTEPSFQDDASLIISRHREYSDLTTRILSDPKIWDKPLHNYPGLTSIVHTIVTHIERQGILATINYFL